MDIPITLNTLMQFTGSLGAFIIIIWLYVQEKRSNSQSIKEKDAQIINLFEKTLQAFEKNATVNTELANTIKENTNATKTLTQRVTDVLIGKGKNG